ncbi:MAG: hypothetical protein IT344_03765 [Candidatus Dadabacteria bacterium]|nr:hypothetical protein [Candidatus Dadabacteria bacterium]
MTRYISLSLILIILVCYSGFRPDALASPPAAPGEMEPQHPGCHGMAREADKTAPGKGASISPEPGESASTCCLESLVNASVDNNFTVRTVVFTVPPVVLDSTTVHALKGRDVASKEHSPPELEIINSSLLL